MQPPIRVEESSGKTCPILLFVVLLASTVGCQENLPARHNNEPLEQVAESSNLPLGDAIPQVSHGESQESPPPLVDDPAKANGLPSASTPQMLPAAFGLSNTMLAATNIPEEGDDAASEDSDPAAIPPWRNAAARISMDGHSEPVTHVLFSNDGQNVISAGSDQTIRVWDVRFGTERLCIKSATGGINALALHPDGRRLLSASGAATPEEAVSVWDLNTGQLLKRFAIRTAHLAISPDGATFFTTNSWYGSPVSVGVHDIESGMELRRLIVPKDSEALKSNAGQLIRSIALTPDGRYLKCVSWPVVYSWDLRVVDDPPQEHRLSIQTPFSEMFVLSRDGQFLCVDAKFTLLPKSLRSLLSVWGWVNGDLCEVGREPAVREAGRDREAKWRVPPAVSPSRQLVAAPLDKSLRILSLKKPEMECVRILEGHTRPIRDVAVSPDGRLIASGSDDHTVRIWDLDHTGDSERVRLGYNDYTLKWEVEYPQERLVLVAGFADHSVRLWTVDDPRELQCFRGHETPVIGISRTQDGRLVFASALDGTIRVWNAHTGVLTHTLSQPGSPLTVLRFTTSPDGRWVLAQTVEHSTLLWSLEKPASPLEMPINGESAGRIEAAAFSPDGTKMLTASYSDELILWDPETARRIHTLGGQNHKVLAVGFSRDGQHLLASLANGSMQCWDTRSGKFQKEPQESLEKESEVHNKIVARFQMALQKARAEQAARKKRETVIYYWY